MAFRFRNSSLLLRLSFLAALSVSVGCSKAVTTPVAEATGDSHSHEHEHRPESFAAAVTELVAHRDAIRSGIESGKSAVVHDPLHEVAELLDAFPDIAAETDLAKDDWEAVKAASDRLFDSFGVIDEAFHKKDGDKKAAYESVAKDIDEAMQAIQSRLPLAAPADATSQTAAPPSNEATGR
jgi:hypothetical protein